MMLGFRKNKRANLLGDTPGDEGYDQPEFVQVLSGLMTFSTGIFLTIVRLYEPLIRMLLMQWIYGFFGEIYEPELADADGLEELKK